MITKPSNKMTTPFASRRSQNHVMSIFTNSQIQKHTIDFLFFFLFLFFLVKKCTNESKASQIFSGNEILQTSRSLTYYKEGKTSLAHRPRSFDMIHVTCQSHRLSLSFHISLISLLERVLCRQGSGINQHDFHTHYFRATSPSE